MSRFLIVAFLTLGLCSCLPSPYYQKAETIPDYAWDYGFKPVYKFDISDTTVYYNMFFIIRHTEAYQFSNIWLNFGAREPGMKKFTDTRIEIPLAAPSGQWLGRGMGEIWEQRMFLKQFHFNKTGTYEVRLQQDMRVNPLSEILQAGIRLERTGQTIAPAGS